MYPYFIYSYTTWAITYKSSLDIMVKLQKKIIRIITFSGYNAHTNVLFHKFKILSFQSLDVYLTGLFMYKVKYHLVPNVIRTLFTDIVNIHDYNTRQRNNFYSRSFRTNLGKFSITSHGPFIWKSIPCSLYSESLINIYV